MEWPRDMANDNRRMRKDLEEAHARIERLEALLQTSESLKRGYFDEIERLQAALAGKDLRHKKSPPAEADGR